MKKIHLVPLGGLGNRIRTISSVYNYCRSLGIPLTVHWHCSHRWGMAVPFRTIFEPFPHGIGLVDNKWGDFFNYLSDICEALDVATPVLLKTHIFNYAKFNRVTFLPRDFTEPVNFDKLILENILR